MYPVRGLGAEALEIGLQEFRAGLYFAPELILEPFTTESLPPHMIISEPVQTAVW